MTTAEPPEGATPLDSIETEGLLHDHVITRGELDELEEANVQIGMEWAFASALLSRRRADVLTEEFLYELHRRMFGRVWSWAGEVRLTEKNIGVERSLVRVEVRKLVEDARYWRENGTYDPDELAVRFHHRLVSIHPFSNGNGRHARLMADLIVQQSGRPAFSWGGRSLVTTSALRSEYIGALRRADEGDMRPLVAFARS